MVSNWVKIFLFSIFCSFLVVPSVFANSLEECRKPKVYAEKMICDEEKTEEFASYDIILNMFYKEAMRHVGNKQEFVATQKNWLKNVRNACSNAECLRQAYKSRNSELQQMATLCKPEEIVVYSCTLQDKKVVSLCVSPDAGPNSGYMQYRLGRNSSNLDMQFPRDLKPAKNFFKYSGDTSFQKQVIAFRNGDDSYSVFKLRTRYCEYSGVALSRGHPIAGVSSKRCMKDESLRFDEYIGYSKFTWINLGEKLGLQDATDDENYIGCEDGTLIR